MRVLVTASSRHGATAEIAEAIASRLRERGLDVDSPPVEELAGVVGFDAVVLGSAVYYGHWLDPARELAERSAGALADCPVWLFSSGPLGPPGQQLPEGEAVDVEALVQATRASGHRVFAGKLDRSSLKFRERAVVSALKAPEGDFRDWDAIAAFADEIADALAEGAAA